MANERRVLRLQQLILEVAAETIQREARNPILALVSILRVKLTSDLSSAQVYWSCLDNDQGLTRTEAAMEGIQPLVQSRVGDALGLRLTPRLTFRFDPSLQNTQRLDTIFHKLREERGESATEGEASGEGAPTEDQAD